jgi:hypothetical protein
MPAASAQSIFITPRAGLNMTNITNTEGSLRTGLNFGISADYVHSSRIGVEFGMHYSMQGSQFKFADVSPEHNYLTIPVLLKYYVSGEGAPGTKGLAIFGGPQLDVKALVNKVGYTPNTSGVLLNNDMTQALGASIVIGGEYLFENGLVLSANMNIGLTNKAKAQFVNYGTIVNTTGSYRDMVFQIKFGYRFAL